MDLSRVHFSHHDDGCAPRTTLHQRTHLFSLAALQPGHPHVARGCSTGRDPGVSFDSGCTFRPGARFGPEAVRRASRIVRPVSIYHGRDVLNELHCVDLGDLTTNPFSIRKTVDSICTETTSLLSEVDRIVTIGGDHTISYPLLKAVNSKFGRVCLVHFDSHFDTWDEYFGESLTHGTPFKRVFEENLIDVTHSIHVGIRGTVNTPSDVADDARLGFDTVFCHETETLGVSGIVERIRQRVGDAPVYISLDIDVADPAYAPGTGTPEVGGYTSSELLAILRGLSGLHVIGGDVVEVCPAYDTGDITAHLAATLCFELVCLL